MKVKQDKEPYTLHPLSFSFTDADGDAAYPIVGASYAILFKKLPKDKGPVIVTFLVPTVQPPGNAALGRVCVQVPMGPCTRAKIGRAHV